MKKIKLLLPIGLLAGFLAAGCKGKPFELRYFASEGGYVIGNSVQTLSKGESGLEVEAVPKDGYIFEGWSDGQKGAKRTDSASEDLSLTANFSKIDTFNLEYLAGEGGFIVGNPLQELKIGESGLEVEAVPKEGYEFSGWSDGEKNAKRTDTPSENLSLTAKFKKIETFTLEYLAGEGGYIVGNPLQTLQKGESGSEVEALTGEGYTFQGWSDGETSLKRRDVNVSEDKKVTAEFAKIITHTAVYSAGEGGYIVGDREQIVPAGENASPVEAVPTEGYVFQGWSDGKTDPVRTDEALTADISPEALFKRVYHINIFSIDENIGRVMGGGRFQCTEGESLTVEAVPAVGYQFTEWSDGSRDPKRTFLPTQDMVLYAKFEIEPLSLPVFEINTEEGKPIVDKENYVRCTVSVSNTENLFEFQGEMGKIKGRGNTTWNQMPKKPYKLKFDEKVDLFGFGAAKTWVLLADYGDKSLLRNRLAQTMGEALGLEFNNKTMPVEVYLNGHYEGEYLVCKQTEAGKNRVDINEEPSSTDPSFLVELDSRAVSEGAENVDWFSLNGIFYGVKSPETDKEGYPVEVTAAIREKLMEFWNALECGDYKTVQSKIDVESFAKTYLVSELVHNVDVDLSSWFLYRDRGGKLKSGPLWDFDVSMGNVNYKDEAKDPRVLYATQNVWYRKLLEYPEFRELVGKLLREYQERIETSVSKAVAEAKQNQDSYLRNFERWNILGAEMWPNPPEIVALKTWEEQVDFVVNYLKESYAFLLETYS